MWVGVIFNKDFIICFSLFKASCEQSFLFSSWMRGRKEGSCLKSFADQCHRTESRAQVYNSWKWRNFKVIHWPVVSWSWAQVNFLKVEFSLLPAYVRSIINWGGHFPKHPPRASLLALAKCVYYIYKSREWKGHSIATSFSTHSACHLLDPRWNKTTFPSASVSTAVTWPSFTFAGLFPGQSAVSSSRNTDSSSSQDGAHPKIAHRRLWKMQTHLVTGVGGKNAGLF